MIQVPYWKTAVSIVAAFGFAAISISCSEAGGQEAKSKDMADASGPGIVVVELFTSEGCSSCPPADALLAEIIDNARRSGSRVYPIAFHVDYWDRLGWRDPFSSAEASARQQQYAQAFKSEQIYTPQMMVNGQVEFVGSDRQKATKAIATAIARPASATISLSIQNLAENQLSVDYVLQNNGPSTVLNLVLVERGLTTKVARGENGGRTLSHDNVARVFKTIPVAAERGQVVLSVPAGVNLSKCSVIGFVQNEKSMEISGAAGIDVPQPLSSKVVSNEAKKSNSRE